MSTVNSDDPVEIRADQLRPGMWINLEGDPMIDLEVYPEVEFMYAIVSSVEHEFRGVDVVFDLDGSELAYRFRWGDEVELVNWPNTERM